MIDKIIERRFKKQLVMYKTLMKILRIRKIMKWVKINLRVFQAQREFRIDFGSFIKQKFKNIN